MKVSTDILEVIKQNQKTEVPQNTTKEETSIGFQKTQQVGISYGANQSGNAIGIYDMTEQTTVSDIKDMAENADMKTIRNSYGVMSNSVSSDDVKEMLGEGYNYNDMEVDSIVTVVDKIKIKLASTDSNYEAYGDDIDVEKAQEVTGNIGMAISVAKKFKEEDLPVTDENLTETMDALQMTQSMQGFSAGTMKYMLNNQMTPSIENIYKAEYSADSSGAGGSYGIGYFTEGGGYVGKTSADFDFTQLQGQMSQVIEASGLSVNEETMQDAQWLIENNIPLTSDTLNAYQELKSISFPLDSDKVLSSITNALQEGKQPSQALLTDNKSIYERARNACEVIQNATEEDVKTLLFSNQEITIENLKGVQQDSSDIQETSQEFLTLSENDSSLVTARRQLEEIRLQMSAEANVRLIRQGVTIETESMEDLIDSLKQAETSMLEQSFQRAGVEASEETISLYQNTISKVDALKTMPSYVIGKVATGEVKTNVNGIYEEGSELKAQLDKASEVYETLMTKPRKDMGDSIKKAFQNVDDILEDINLETTEANQRAVRILGYNNMEITKENIMTVKEADVSVNQLMKNMTPTVALALIRSGKNPLNTDIDELNEEISEFKEALQNDSEENYSKFLYQLEKNNSITEQERASYIGIYRLINNVDKSDGGAIGALVNQNADITLNNLLSAVRTTKSKGMDVTIDDTFGGLEELTFTGSRISDQLEASFGSHSEESEKTKAQSYYEYLTGQALEEITPSKLQQLFPDGQLTDLSLEQFVQSLSGMQAENSEEQAYYTEQQKAFQQTQNVEESVFNILKSYDQPLTISNILAASGAMNGKNSIFKKLDETKETCSDKGNEAYEEAVNQLSESLDSKESLQEVMENVKEAAEQILTEATEQDEISSIDLKEIKMMRKEIQLTTNLSKEERYQIPVFIEGELTSIQLTILHNDQESGKVNVSFESQNMGKVAAELTVSNGEVSGHMAASSKEALEWLQESQDTIEQTMLENGLKAEPFQYMKSDSLDLIKWEEKNTDIKASEDEQKKEETKMVQTKDCYRAAKALITAIKSFEKSKEVE